MAYLLWTALDDKYSTYGDLLMWPFEGDRKGVLPMVPKLNPAKGLSTEEILVYKLLQLENHVQQLEQSMVAVAEAFKQLAANQNESYLAIQRQFLGLVNYVMRPSKSIMPGEQQDKN